MPRWKCFSLPATWVVVFKRGKGSSLATRSGKFLRFNFENDAFCDVFELSSIVFPLL